MTTGRRSDLAPLACPLSARAAALLRVDDDREKVRRALAQMSALGGDAGWLAEQLAPRTAAWPDERLQRRDAAIIAMVPFCELGSEREIAKQIRQKALRYETTRWRRERMLAAPPLTAGTEGAALFGLLRASGASGAPGDKTIRNALAAARAGQNLELSVAQGECCSQPSNSRRSRKLNTTIKPNEIEVLAALARRPDVQKTVADEHARAVAERQARVDRIAAIDKRAAVDWPAEQAVIKAASVKFREAVRKLREADDALSAANAASSTATLARTAARQIEEAAMIAGADGATIAAWQLVLLDEIDKLRRPGAIIAGEQHERNPVTRRATIRRFSNAASVRARLLALRDAFEASDLLKLEPDQARLPAIIAELRASLPKVDQSPDFAETEA